MNDLINSSKIQELLMAKVTRHSVGEKKVHVLVFQMFTHYHYNYLLPFMPLAHMAATNVLITLIWQLIGQCSKPQEKETFLYNPW